MSAARRGFHMKQTVAVVDVGCGCRRPKLSSLLSSLRRPKSRPPSTPHSISSSSLWASTATSAAKTNSTFSPSSYEVASPLQMPKEKERRGERRSRKIKKTGPASVAAQSVAVVKESSEPYADFRDSMVQMIVEKELYTWEDLNDLLHRFLSLNSPRYHHLILHAFTDLWSVEN
ncbi:hypothetical protein KSP39_PZI007187 [Platanthera zijinensis]|uniref:Transcription repressor n=1 Tax=Platanthera zijinensis TaxID=2320716 RepID=A0AAP0BQR7_9ASPA